MKNNINRSPLFYVGDKFKLLPQIIKLFPRNIDNFYEPFLGGGSVFLNVKAKKYFLNDIDEQLINLHRFLYKSSFNKNEFFKQLEHTIYKFKLSRSYIEDIIPANLKKENKKTYFARFNKKNYHLMRDYYNNSKNKQPLILYILLIYGFNRMLRFNSKGDYNIPVGNVDLNMNVIRALNDYFEIAKREDISFFSNDYKMFLKRKFKKDDFIYLDPPYLITFSEYNKLWNRNDEIELLSLLNEMNANKIKFAISNVTYYKDKKNDILLNWIKNYHSFKIKSNYISYHNNSLKNIEEVLITNYEPN